MLDKTDLLIIKELTENSRITMKELGEKVHLTGPAASARVAKLEESGIIKGYTVALHQVKMGFTVHTIITVFTKDIHHQPYLSYIRSQPEYVLHNYKVSGEGCYMLECRFPSNDELDTFLLGLNQYVNYKLSIIIKDA